MVNVIFIILFAVLLLIIIVYLLRKIKKQKWVGRLSKRWTLFAKNNNDIPLWQHVSVIFLGICISIPCYVTLIAIHKPRFTMPKTDAINWYTAHHYPRQQDAFYFVTSFAFVFLITCVIWSFWIWEKNRQ
jgi:hypothetical protein